MPREEVVEGRLEQPDQVVDLLELPPRVGVEVAVTGEQVQLAQQLRGLAREQLAANALGGDLAARAQTETTSTSSGIASRSFVSMPIFRVMVEEGQPLQAPRSWR